MAPPARSDPTRLVHVGLVARAHGVRGALKVRTFDAQAPSLRPGVVIHVRKPGNQDGAVFTATLVTVQPRPPDAVIVTLDPPLTREGADALHGHDVLVDESALPPLGQGEVWAYQLPGFQAVDSSGKPLGTVVGLVAGVAHDMLAVDTGQGVGHVPMVEAVVLSMDLATRTVVLNPPAGLLDDPELLERPRRKEP